MGRTRGFVIAWPVRIYVEDGRTFIVEQTDASELRICVEGSAEWRTIDPQLYGYGVPSVGAVVGRTLRWWRETTGEPIIIGRRRED
jgi:hypothetical protein